MPAKIEVASKKKPKKTAAKKPSAKKPSAKKPSAKKPTSRKKAFEWKTKSKRVLMFNARLEAALRALDEAAFEKVIVDAVAHLSKDNVRRLSNLFYGGKAPTVPKALAIIRKRFSKLKSSREASRGIGNPDTTYSD